MKLYLSPGIKLDQVENYLKSLINFPPFNSIVTVGIQNCKQGLFLNHQNLEISQDKKIIESIKTVFQRDPVTFPTVQPMNILNALTYINPILKVVYTGIRSYDSNIYTQGEQINIQYVNSIFQSICKMLPLLNP